MTATQMDISIWVAGKVRCQLSCESAFDKRTCSVSGKVVALYPAMQAERPLIVLNTYTGDGESVMHALDKTVPENTNLLVIGNLDWNYDLKI